MLIVELGNRNRNNVGVIQELLLRNYHYRNLGIVQLVVGSVVKVDIAAEPVAHIALVVEPRIVAMVCSAVEQVFLVCLPTSYYSCSPSALMKPLGAAPPFII